MKKITFLILLIGSVTFLQAQTPSPSQLMKTSWAKILKQYKPKKTTDPVVDFDPDPNSVEWPLLYHPEYNPDLYNDETNVYHVVDEIDREKLKNYEYEVPTPLGWPSAGPVRALSDFFRFASGSITKYRASPFDTFNHINDHDDFKKALIQRYGSTKNIYCLADDINKSEFVVVFFIVKNGVPKMIGLYINYYSG